MHVDPVQTVISEGNQRSGVRRTSAGCDAKEVANQSGSVTQKWKNCTGDSRFLRMGSHVPEIGKVGSRVWLSGKQLEGVAGSCWVCLGLPLRLPGLW